MGLHLIIKIILWKSLRYSICQLPIYGEFYSDFRLRETQNPRVLTEGGVENERLALFWGFSASGLLRFVFAAEHDDLARADVFHDFELLEQTLQGINLGAVSGNLDNHGSHRHVHGIGVEMVAQLQDFGALFCSATDLDKGEFLFDGVCTGMVLRLHNVDQLFELLDDLHQDFRIAVSDDVHAAEV